jgi:hypothetical protein
MSGRFDTALRATYGNNDNFVPTAHAATLSAARAPMPTCSRQSAAKLEAAEAMQHRDLPPDFAS